MKVFFHCPECKVEARVDVPDRLQAVDIRLWLEGLVMPRVARVHTELSPLCQYPAVDLAIPVDNDKLAGQAVDRPIPDTMPENIRQALIKED